MFAFDNTYAHLPDRFFARVKPTAVAAPRILAVNPAVAALVGASVEELASASGAGVLAGNALPDGADPIAIAYAGHQFGSFVPQLGDGRAILLGEVVGKDGVRRDVQLKGAGRTPFSRGGDGRAALGPVLREYIVSEAMAALGIPTTRALAAVATGEAVFRDEMLPGAVLTRVAASHIRVGTFEFFAAREDREGVATLASYALQRHYPHAQGSGNDALALLECVVTAHATLVPQWLGVGFIHGVMNTDNTTISGETIDYGPCAFLDEFDPRKKFSAIDRTGRYAFAQQPMIAQWNLARLGEALLPLVDDNEQEAVRIATERLQRFGPQFDVQYTRVLRSKLGLSTEESGDRALAEDLLGRMAENNVDYTLFFRRLCAAAAADAAGAAPDAEIAAMFAEPNAWREWAERWRERTGREPDATASARVVAMRAANPAFIPRNHRVEEALRAAEGNDFAPFETLVRVLARPFDEQPEAAHLATPPQPEERVQRTFCGT